MALSVPGLTGGWKKFADMVCNKLTDKARTFMEKYAGANLIIVTGPTGVGKSSFIKLITCQDVYVGSTLKSGTTNTALVPAVIDGRNYLFLDMPGFNANDLDDWQIFNMLMTAMVTVQRYVTFRGVLYVDTLNERRLTPPAHKILTWLTQLCGSQYMPNVTIVTTMWDGLDDDGIEDKLARYEMWRAEELSQRFFFHGAKEYHHGLVREHGRHRTLNMQRKASERKNRALQMIKDHYRDLTHLTMRVCDEIARGWDIQMTSAGRWLKTGSMTSEAHQADTQYTSSSSEQGEQYQNKNRASHSQEYSSRTAQGNQSSGFWSGIRFEDVRPWMNILFKAAQVYMRASPSPEPAEWFEPEDDIFSDSGDFFLSEPFEEEFDHFNDLPRWCAVM